MSTAAQNFISAMRFLNLEPRDPQLGARSLFNILASLASMKFRLINKRQFAHFDNAIVAHCTGRLVLTVVHASLLVSYFANERSAT